MNQIERAIREPAFQQRLRDGRGSAPVLMVYRGESVGPTCDDGIGGRGVALLEECLDDIERAAGLKIANANVFCADPRTTLTVQFAIPHADADLAVYHDTVSGDIDMQIMHGKPVEVSYPSHSELMMAHADPWTQLDRHFDERGAESVKALMQRLDMVPADPPSDIAVHVHQVLPVAGDAMNV